MANTIETEIILKLDELKKQLSDAEKHGEESGKKMGDAFGSKVESAIAKPFEHLKSELIGIGAAVAGAFAFEKTIEAASKQEAAQERFNSALAMTGQLVDGNAEHFNEFAEGLSKVTSASRESILEGSSMLVMLGKLRGEGLERTTKAALDLAAGLHMDVQSAFDVMSKAANGNTAFLHRWGLQVIETGNKAKDFAQALAFVERQFGGLAAGHAQTFQGVMARMKNSLEEAAGAVGMVITRNSAVIASMKAVADGFDRLTHYVNSHRGELIRLAGQGIGYVIEGFATFIQIAAPVAEFLGNNMTRAVGFVRAEFERLNLMIEGTILGYLKVKEFLKIGDQDQLRVQILAQGQAFESSKEHMAEYINMMKEGGHTFDGFGDKATALAAKFRTFGSQVGASAHETGQVIAKNLTQPTEDKLPSHWSFITNGFNHAFGVVEMRSAQAMRRLQAQLNSAFDAFKTGFAQSFAAIGEALVKHESVMQAFAKALLNVFGDLAIQIGTFYFMLGIAEFFVNPAQGGAEMAAGLGLIILGGALKGISGMMGAGGGAPAASAGGGGGGGGYGSSSGGYGGDLAATSAQTDDQRQQQTAVAVHIHGNVLDRRETGLAILDVLNEQFATNGGSFQGSLA